MFKPFIHSACTGVKLLIKFYSFYLVLFFICLFSSTENSRVGYWENHWKYWCENIRKPLRSTMLYSFCLNTFRC